MSSDARTGRPEAAHSPAAAGLFIAILLVPLPVRLSAQQLVFEEFGFDRGLGNSAVNCLREDSRGFLWVGTMSGLYRGDGERFERFGEAQGLPDETIQSLLEDSRGRLWAATRRGVAWLENGRFHEAPFPRPVLIFARRALALASDGRIYAATAQGLFSLGPGERRFEPYRLADPPGQTAMDAVFAAPDGTLWLSAAKTLWRLSQGGLERWGPERGVPASRWDDFLVDPGGTLWVRGADALIALPAGRQTFEDRTHGLPASGFFGSLALDHAGRLAVPTDNGLYVLEGPAWKRYGVEQGLPGQSVSVVLDDREGSFWLGLWGLGLLRVAGYGNTENWTMRDGLPSSTVSAILEDSRGVIWAGTDDGLAVLAPGARRWKKWIAPGLCGTKVRALALGPDSSIWAGCYPGGISRIGPGGRRQTWRPGDGRGPDRVNGLLVDAAGRLWVASLEGLYRSRAPADSDVIALERVKPPNAPPEEGYFRMALGRRGEVWIAASHGLLCWTDGQWRRYGAADGLRDSAVTHLAVAPDGAVWVAYRRPLGVSRLRPGGGADHYLDTLSSPSPLLVRSDRAGRIWIGGDNGLDIVEGPVWSRFHRADGLGAHSCAVDAFLAARDGSIWIGTSRGITRILHTGKALAPPPRPIPLAIAWIQLGDKPITDWAEGPLRGDPFRRSFAAGLAALTFRYRSGLKFRYRLRGSHDNWIETEQPVVRYSSLPPGGYTFEASLVSPHRQVSQAAVAVPFVIPAPFYMAWWFRLVLAAMTLAGIRLAWRWRIRTMQRRQRWLEEAVRERTRQLRAEKERADQASRFKSEFLARMSHEIRTPLHGVIGTADLLARTPLDAAQQELVATLRDSASVLMHLLNDILDLSRVEAGRLPLEIRPFDLAAVARTVASLMRPMAAARGLELRFSAPDGPVWRLGDAHRVQQILLNLVSNAVKFTDRGFVAMAMRTAEDGSVELEVRDTGRGIPADSLGSIFQPFVQAAPADSGQPGGAGLGLAITKALAEAMGGTIEVESEPGKGSAFRVRLPLPPAEAPAAGPALTEKQEAERSLRVLVVEDNPVNQRMLARMLESMGHQPEAASDGETALALAARGGYDVILLDIRLPGIDGLETARRLRASGCNVPILALSANVYESDRAAALAAGMDGFLGKPLHLDELRQALRGLPRRSSGG